MTVNGAQPRGAICPGAWATNAHGTVVGRSIDSNRPRPLLGRAQIHRSRRRTITVHEALFTSGEYVKEFTPEAANNPFAFDYARKKDMVVATVSGSDRRVLDIGGGMGRMSIPLSRRHFVTLTDISPQMLDLAAPHASDRLRLRQADARRLPFADESFDFVLCIDVLPHIPEPADAVAEARRVLSPGGTLVIDVTNSVPLWTLAYPSYLGRRPSRWMQIWRAGGVLPGWRNRVRHHRRTELVSLLASAGFEVRSMHRFGPRLCPKWHVAVAVKK